MKIYCCGSANLDFVYRMPHFVRPGETIAATERSVYCGGKGLNQAIALARAGLSVSFVGRIGADGSQLLRRLSAEGIDTSLCQEVELPTGHAVIQVTDQGENNIILFPGANHSFTSKDPIEVLASAQHGDFLVLQNEVSCVNDFIVHGRAKGMKIIFTPSPMSEAVKSYSLEAVDFLFLNEVELKELTGFDSVDAGITSLGKRMPSSQIVVTLGEKGAVHWHQGTQIFQDAIEVKVVDTTAAGDTFLGFFMASYLSGDSARASLERAAKAASICVSRAGASDSIPRLLELQESAARSK
jgi:ribokinase